MENLINCVYSTNPVHNDPDKPVGFIRSKVQNRSILHRTLIDSGNLFGDLISEDFAKMLKLPIYGKKKVVGTAAKKGTVTILGKIRPFKIYVEGISEALTVCPYVVQELAQPMNLGQAFLRRYEADLNFRQKGVILRLKGSSSMLEASDCNLTRPSIDTRIKQVLDKFKSEGSNPWSEKAAILDLRVHQVDEEEEETSTNAPIPGVFYKPNKKLIEFEPTRTTVSIPVKTLVKAMETTPVVVFRGKGSQEFQPAELPQNDVYVIPKTNNKWMNKNNLFVHPGTYHRSGNQLKVLVTNFDSADKHIPAGCNMGSILEACQHIPPTINELSHKPVKDLTEAELVERRAFIYNQLKLDDNEMLQEHPELKQEVANIFMDNFEAVAINDSDFGRTNLMRFQMQMIPGAQPVRAKMRPLNPTYEKDLDQQLDAWLEAGVIEPSASAWSSALVPCKKKGTDKLRWALDYRKVNALTVKDAYPLASIETNLHKLSGTSIFSTLDSAGAFHTISVDQASRDFTAFNTHRGQFRFARCPFGLSNVPSCYSRLVQMALDRLPPGFALAYIDDIICHSHNLHDHVDHLRQVVKLHVAAGMKLNLAKCNLFQKEVEYLGHLVSKDGIRMIPSYVARILDWPLPTNAKELRSFLGFTGYYRSFIKKYGELTCEMNQMRNSRKDLTWSEENKAKFEQLKQCFAEQPVRGYPRYDSPEPFILDTDFSSTNMAAVLSQLQDGKEVFLGCCAKKCDKAQSNYPSAKGECAAVNLGLRKFEHILRAKKFILRTDSKSMEFMHNLKEFRGIWARWQNWFCSFDFDVQHRAGTKQTNADALSRRPGVPDVVEGVLDTDPVQPYHDVEDIYHVQEAKVVTLQDLQQQSTADPVLQTVMRYVKLQHKPSKEERKQLSADGMRYVNIFECLTEEDGVLYYQGPVLNNKPSAKRICLPLTLQNLAFEMCHADPSGTSGHFGMTSTFRKMKSRFYFPNMFHFIAARINNCVSCITKKAHLPKPTHQQHHEELSYFGQRVYTDVVGILTAARYQGQSCQYILTIQDGFTRYLVATPIPNQTTETIVTALLDKWIYVFGVPETIHSDNGANFSSKLYQEVMRQLGIIKTFTPVYSPSGNRVERSHRVIGDILRADRSKDGHRWPEKLPAAVLAYNAAVNRMIGVSPYEAVFGHPVSLPIDLIFPFDKPEGVSWSTHVKDMKLKFSKLCQAICKTQNTAISRENARYQARSAPEFQVGDFCYCFLVRIQRGLSRKLQSRWCGPWKIIKKVSDSLFVIYPQGSWCENPREMAVIANRLKKISPGQTDHSSSSQPLNLDIISDDCDEWGEFLTYQEDIEGEEKASLPVRPVQDFRHPDPPPASLEVTQPEVNSDIMDPEPSIENDSPDTETTNPEENETPYSNQDETPYSPPVELRSTNQDEIPQPSNVTLESRTVPTFQQQPSTSSNVTSEARNVPTSQQYTTPPPTRPKRNAYWDARARMTSQNWNWKTFKTKKNPRS